jgi:DNA-binding NarL/FixJ family response regulator
MSEMSEQIRVAIIEDELRTRDGLRDLIGSSAEFLCVGAWESVETAMTELRGPAPHVVLVDLGLPGMSGIEGIPVMRRRFPDSVFVVLTVYEENRRVFDALCAGAHGYLLKTTPPGKLLDGLRDATRGGSPMSPEIARKVVEVYHRFRPPQQANYGLTPHELRLLKLLSEGHSYKTAAHKLGVTINTISFHVRNIYDKLQVHSKSEAVARAMRENLIG